MKTIKKICFTKNAKTIDLIAIEKINNYIEKVKNIDNTIDVDNLRLLCYSTTTKIAIYDKAKNNLYVIKNHDFINNVCDSNNIQKENIFFIGNLPIDYKID